jgi:hypothetical protein
MVPLPVLSARLVRGVAPSVDLRVRYDTVMGLSHRLGVEVRASLARRAAWAVAASVTPSAQFVMMPYHGLYTAGDVSTHAALLATARTRTAALTFEAGATVQWVVFNSGGNRLFVDPRPRLAFVDVGARVEWALSAYRTLLLGVEVSVSTDRDDPIALGGTFPRVTFGGTWSR